MRLAFPLIALFAIRFISSAILAPPVDGDLYWQDWLGARILASGAIPRALGDETFTAAGATWIPQEWLFSIAVHVTRSTGTFWIFKLVTALAATGALVFMALDARRVASPVATAAVIVFCGIALLESFGVRAQVAGWFFFAAFLFALRSEGRARWWCVPIAIAWANVHASAMIAPVLASTVLFGSVIDERRVTRRLRHALALTATVTVAIACTPFGLELPHYALTLTSGTIRHAIKEWQPSNFGDIAFIAGAFPLLALGIARLAVWRAPASQRLLAIGMLFLTIDAARNVPLAALALAPAAAAMLDALGLRRVRAGSEPVAQRFRPMLIAMTGAAIAGVLIVAGIQMVHAAGLTRSSMPERALSRLAALPGEHRLFCTDFAWCSLALEKSNVSVFLDGRCDPFPAPVWDDYLAIVKRRAGWRERLDRRAVNAIVLDRKRDRELAGLLAKTWTTAYSDDRHALYVRRPPAGR